MGDLYGLVRTQVKVTTDQLLNIIHTLGITRKQDVDRILNNGMVIVKTAPPPGSSRRSARTRSSGSSTEGRASSTGSRTSRRQT
jgi:hypothetical protein